MFKKLVDWICSLCSNDEIAQINEQKKIIENLTNENNSLKNQIAQLNQVIEDLNDSNKMLKEQLENINFNRDKAQKFDIITEYVEPEILNQMLEMMIR